MLWHSFLLKNTLEKQYANDDDEEEVGIYREILNLITFFSFDNINLAWLPQMYSEHFFIKK